MKTQIKILTLFAITLIMSSCKKENMGNETVTDIDGNIYHTVKIGTQTWTVENLKTIRYNDGTPIPNGLSNTDWAATTSGAFAIFNDDPLNNDVYGKLYNWYAVNSNILAPKGWHIPTAAEWTTLQNFLGNDAGKLKVTDLWVPSTVVVNTNSTGFSALPGGERDFSGQFFFQVATGFFWSSTVSSSFAKYMALSYANSNIQISVGPMSEGFSVRCIKD